MRGGEGLRRHQGGHPRRVDLRSLDNLAPEPASSSRSSVFRQVPDRPAAPASKDNLVGPVRVSSARPLRRPRRARAARRRGRTPEQASEIAAELGGTVVIKAQVKVGGRGKAGGVKLADGPDDAKAKATAILGMDIKGHTVHRVLVAEASDIAEEYYFSFLLDRSNRTFLAMASREGGVEIEQIAVEKPDALAKIPVDAIVGVDLAKAREIAIAASYPEEILDQAAAAIVALWDVFTGEDATLVEVNPLVKTPDGVVLALDGKVTLDDNAAFRQPGHADLVDAEAADPLEARAKEANLNYVKLDGEVGIIGNGAGLVMSTLDVVSYAGAAVGGVRPANFLDIGGGASADVMAASLTIVLVRSVRALRLRQRVRRHHRMRRGRERHRRRVREVARRRRTDHRTTRRPA